MADITHFETGKDFQNVPVPSVIEEIAPVEQRSIFRRTGEFIARKKTTLALGTTALSVAVAVTNNPVSELYHDVTSAAPWAIGGVMASEGLFVTGAVMMAASVGDKISNPFKLKSRIPEIAQKAHDSKLFKTGFWINTVGALGTAAVASGAIVVALPPEAYPALTVPLVDIGITVVARKAINDEIRSHVTLPSQDLRTVYPPISDHAIAT